MRRLLLPIFVITAFAMAVACGPPAECYPGGPEHDYCSGNILEMDTQCADDPDRVGSVSRQDCGSDLCIVDFRTGVGSCAHPCDGNADCPLDQFCGWPQAVSDGRTVCEPSADVFGQCVPDNPRSCVAGLSCLVLHHTTDPSKSPYQCGITCATDADCGLLRRDDYPSGYCSAVILTEEGAKTCDVAEASSECDPANPNSCPAGLTCRQSPPPGGGAADGGSAEDGGAAVPVTYACEQT